jgi:hypothetical protein
MDKNRICCSPLWVYFGDWHIIDKPIHRYHSVLQDHSDGHRIYFNVSWYALEGGARDE